jgi:hypothetical protein
MKPSVFNKMPTFILWICMSITLILSVGFYITHINHPENTDSTATVALLNWIYVLLFITLSATILFAGFYLVRQWKMYPKKILQSVVGIFVIGLLLSLTFLFGNGQPLLLVGYKGHENTYSWLKITDMWLYSIYILLALGFLALFGGILWSYLKKLK